MNVYDFDGTIFPSNCSVGFCIWCMNRHPKMWFKFFPKAAIFVLKYKMGKISESQMLRKFFGYLKYVDDFDFQIERYWDKNEKKIASWYLAQKSPDDLVISASPTCLIEPIAKRLGVRYMASDFDREYGVFVNNMMYAKEKAKYIIDHGFPVIDNFYSDSLSDTPIALCAEKAFLVKKKASKVVDWPNLDKQTMEKVKKKIDTGWNVHLKGD
ncbi:MAG: haloacid dehalogenase-like hydrolase [Clostridiales bacterium]|nr:haloacid dehalogenase-like hydrolase [Clostridiales bacterium]